MCFCHKNKPWNFAVIEFLCFCCISVFSSTFTDSTIRNKSSKLTVLITRTKSLYSIFWGYERKKRAKQYWLMNTQLLFISYIMLLIANYRVPLILLVYMIQIITFGDITIKNANSILSVCFFQKTSWLKILSSTGRF